MRRAALIFLALCFLSSSTAWAADPSPAQTRASEFVQRFYDWYAPLAHKFSKSPSWVVALSKRGADFDARLRCALMQDADAQRRSPDDIVGLDFDPFLSAQDPKDKYALGNVTESAGIYAVSVYGVRGGKRAANRDVVAELKASNGSFRFTNFRYGADDDLLGTLKLLREQRTRTPQ